MYLVFAPFEANIYIYIRIFVLVTNVHQCLPLHWWCSLYTWLPAFPSLSLLDWITVSHRMAACSVARIEDWDNSYFAIWQFLELVLCFGPLNHSRPLKIIVFSIVNPNFKFVHLFYLNASSLWGHISKTVNKIGLFCRIFCFFVQRASRLAFHPLIFFGPPF